MKIWFLIQPWSQKSWDALWIWQRKNVTKLLQITLFFVSTLFSGIIIAYHEGQLITYIINEVKLGI